MYALHSHQAVVPAIHPLKTQHITLGYRCARGEPTVVVRLRIHEQKGLGIVPATPCFRGLDTGTGLNFPEAHLRSMQKAWLS